MSTVQPDDSPIVAAGMSIMDEAAEVEALLERKWGELKHPGTIRAAHLLSYWQRGCDDAKNARAWTLPRPDLGRHSPPNIGYTNGYLAGGGPASALPKVKL